MVIKFYDEKNIIRIIQSGLVNYETYLLNKSFLYVYYDTLKKDYDFHFKLLTNVSHKSYFINQKNHCYVSQPEKEESRVFSRPSHD